MKYIALIICFFVVLAMQAQNSTYDALKAFLSTDYFSEFSKMKERSEDAVLDFKAIKSRYTEDEIVTISEAYNLSADRFNRVLTNIKRDMLDKQMRKYIATQPTGYSKQVETDFYRAKEYYTNTFQKEIIDLTDGQITGVAFIALIPTVIGYIGKAMKLYQKIQAQLRKINEDMLDKYLIEQFRFKTWDEIE